MKGLVYSIAYLFNFRLTPLRLLILQRLGIPIIILMDKSRLPILEHKKEIMDAIGKERVVVVCGRTGCGKSTQLPQFILQECPDANIAICQPRRLAATSLADRVSEEVKTNLGDKVGYQIGMDSKISSHTQICFMTYGILIQQLLFNKELDYSHIILDQVHERSLEMDFTFIALKKMLDEPGRKKDTKIVIMSATINSKQFADYFSTHRKDPNRHFFHPEFTFKFEKKERRRRGRNTEDEDNKTLIVEVVPKDSSIYAPCQCVDLPDKKRYTVREYFAEDVPDNKIVPTYYINDDVRIADETYLLAVKILRSHLSDQKQENKDVLIFVPGMFEIKKMRCYIEEKIADVSPQSIIEVHSAYSEDLHRKLFKDKINNKIIIATNIGQSSITLPSCTTVIDFCLTRKNIMVKERGYSRFETLVASKSNLLQRAGRVGRTADGEVYRLISKTLYPQLEQFEIPEIKCVTLEMVILRAKQIDKTYGSTLFEDPYEVFLNAIEPPEVSQIHSAIQSLLHQEALINQQEKNWKNSHKQLDRKVDKFEGSELKLTEIGEFMVSMPCELRISKMILLAIQFDISSAVIDIAGIIINPKNFFVHEEKRDNIEEFLHSLVGYDNGNYNDFLLRQKMFAHWRYQFFNPFYEKNKSRVKQQIQEGDDFNNNNVTDRLISEFSDKRIQKSEWNWCNDRGLSPHVLRSILKSTENIRERLKHKGFKIGRRGKVDEDCNELIILCLSLAFEETTCNVVFKPPQANKQKIENYVSFNSAVVANQKDLTDYFYPFDDFKAWKENQIYYVTKSLPSMSKLLLPQYFTKGRKERSTNIFKFLSDTRNGPTVAYTYEQPSIESGFRHITILNDSINKATLRPIHQEEYMLIGDKIFETKGRYFIGANALVERKVLILIKMMTRKKVELVAHCSGQFYSHAFIENQSFELPFLLTPAYLDIILEVRGLSLWEREQNYEKNEVVNKSLKSRVLTVLKGISTSKLLEQWNLIYDQEKLGFKRFEDPKKINIKQAKPLSLQSYFEKYRAWKRTILNNQTKMYYLNTISEANYICSECWPERITTIDGNKFYNFKKGVFELQPYGTAFKENLDQVFCTKGHFLGKKINEEDCKIEFAKLKIYYPYGKVIDFTGNEQELERAEKEKYDGLEEMRYEREGYDQFSCCICCSSEDSFNEVIERKNLKSDKFWNLIGRHLYSDKHLKNRTRFEMSM